MELLKVKIKNFLSIKDEETIKINNTITTIVGLNESGKTTILKAIEKLNGEQIKDNEKNKNADYKRTDSYVIGTFLLKAEEIKKINQASNCKLLVFPETDCYVDINIGDKNNTRYYQMSVINEVKTEQFHPIDIIKGNLLKRINDTFLNDNLENVQKFEDLIIKSSEDNIKTNYNDFISKYKGQEIYDELIDLADELAPDYWIKFIPEYKIIKFSSEDILKDEVSIDDLKENMQVNNLLNIAKINVDDLINSVINDEPEEQMAYENIYEDTVTKKFETIFRQSDNNFKLRIRIDTKKNKMLFYTFDKTCKANPIPLKNRSDGFKWYFSIYITLYEYLQRKDNIKYILLFDEPNLYLNPSAQYDLLERVFKQEFKNDQIIYTTHNPYMIDTTNFASIRIVEKTNCSKIYNTTVDYYREHKCIKNEVDPMTPILTALNIDVSNNLLLDRNKTAIVVEGINDVYILNSMIKRLEYEKKFENVNFIPCFGASKVPLMFGFVYGLGYNVFALTDNDSDGISALEDILGSDEDKSVLNGRVYTYNKTIEKGKDYLLESLFDENDIENYLLPKSTVLYRNFSDNIDSLELEEKTISNFKELFDFLLKKIDDSKQKKKEKNVA